MQVFEIGGSATKPVVTSTNVNTTPAYPKTPPPPPGNVLPASTTQPTQSQQVYTAPPVSGTAPAVGVVPANVGGQVEGAPAKKWYEDIRLLIIAVVGIILLVTIIYLLLSKK